MSEMKFRGVIVDYIDISAKPEKGFNFPFKIIIPKKLSDNPDLIYACNLPENESENCSTMEELIERTKEDFCSIDPMLTHLCLSNGNPMIIPFVPRLKDFRPNFLGRDCLTNNFKVSEYDKKYKKNIYLYNNLADQHKSIIQYAIDCLKNKEINVDEKIIISGYSEGAMFASHFALLHPEIIKSVIAGGTGGAISMPIDYMDGYEFSYPTGTSGLKNFDFDSFQNISFFYYIGKEDRTDSAIPNFDDYHYMDENGNDCILKDECGNKTPFVDENGKQLLKLDENGNYTAKYNLFSDSEVNAINKVLGTVIQKRFIKQQEIYSNLGLNATFKLYSGNHKTIFDNRKEIFDDVDSFLKENLSKKVQKLK